MSVRAWFFEFHKAYQPISLICDRSPLSESTAGMPSAILVNGLTRNVIVPIETVSDSSPTNLKLLTPEASVGLMFTQGIP